VGAVGCEPQLLKDSNLMPYQSDTVSCAGVKLFGAIIGMLEKNGRTVKEFWVGADREPDEKV
jgi:hypothetical protein